MYIVAHKSTKQEKTWSFLANDNSRRLKKYVSKQLCTQIYQIFLMLPQKEGGHKPGDLTLDLLL